MEGKDISDVTRGYTKVLRPRSSELPAREVLPLLNLGLKGVSRHLRRLAHQSVSGQQNIISIWSTLKQSTSSELRGA